MFEFCKTFFLSRPELADNPLFITGESYAGHYVPAVAHRAFVASKKDEGSVNLNLKGFATRNGLTDPKFNTPRTQSIPSALELCPRNRATW